MAIPTFTNPPPAPHRSDPPDVFIVKANAFVAWFSPFEAELESAVVWFNDQVAQVAANAATSIGSATEVAAAAAAVLAVTDYVASSVTSLTLAAGAKTFLLQQSNKSFAVNDVVMLVSRSNPEKRMGGTVTAVAGANMTVSVPAEGIVGTGSAADWVVVLQVFAAVAGTGSDVLRAASTLIAISPKAVRDSYAPFVLTHAATVTPNGQNGLDFKWAITGNATLGAITNTYPGARGSIEITQDATGSRILAVASAWKRSGGLGVLSTAAGSIDELVYNVKTVDGAGTATRIIYNIIRNPT